MVFSGFFVQWYINLYGLFNTKVILAENGPVGWAVEYTDCLSAEACDSSNECPGNDTKQSVG